MKVKPAAGLKVRDPKTLKVLPPEGAEVRGHPTYWERRLQCGDVTLVEEAAPAPAPAAAPAEEQPVLETQSGGAEQ